MTRNLASQSLKGCKRLNLTDKIALWILCVLTFIENCPGACLTKMNRNFSNGSENMITIRTGPQNLRKRSVGDHAGSLIVLWHWAWYSRLEVGYTLPGLMVGVGVSNLRYFQR